MQDVSRVTGNGVVIESKVKGRSFVLHGITFEDLGLIQKRFLREKKLRLLEVAKLRSELEPDLERPKMALDSAAEACRKLLESICETSKVPCVGPSFSQLREQLSKFFIDQSERTIMDKAQEEAGKIALLSDEEFNATIKTPFGATEMLWVLFERQYPGAVSRSDLIRMANAGEFPTDSISQLLSEFLVGPPEGNLTGQSRE